MTEPRARGRRRRARAEEVSPKRDVNYRQLRNPFPTMDVFPADQIANMHDTALRTLEELGIKVLLSEARKIYAAGGARVDEDSEMVWIGRDMVEAAITSAAASFRN